MSGQPHAPAALYPWERPGTHCTGGCVGPRAARPHQDSIPDHPGPSQSLYRLSYPGHTYIYIYIHTYTHMHIAYYKVYINGSGVAGVYVCVYFTYSSYTVNYTQAQRVRICCHNTNHVQVKGHDRTILGIFRQELYKAPW